MSKKLLWFFVFFCSITSVIFSSFSDESNSDSGDSVDLSEGITPLMIAARDGEFKKVKELVRQGHRVDETDNGNFTAFTHALCADQTEIARFLKDEMAKTVIKKPLQYELVTFSSGD